MVEELADLNEKFVFFANDESLVDAAKMKTLVTLIKDAGIRNHYFIW